jgi:hypothetical protein
MISTELLILTVVVEALVVAMMLIAVRRSHAEFTQRWMSRTQAFQSELGKMRGVLHAMQQRVDEAERRADSLASPATPPSGLNVNRRAQAIRMLRRGAHTEQVSAALSMPRQNVELLLRVNELSAEKVNIGPEHSVKSQYPSDWSPSGQV